jgi:predicted transcriptional regulator
LIEATVSAGIALVAAMAALTTRINNRINDVDRRVDGVELLVVRDYVSRNEFVVMQSKIEQHMVRIEEKLDRMLERGQQPS